MENIGPYRLEDSVFMWLTVENKIAAVLNPEAPGWSFLQVHPDYRSTSLEEEMVSVAEVEHACQDSQARRKLTVWAQERDKLRKVVLMDRGYRLGEEVEYQRRRVMEAPISEASIPEGYVIRPLGGIEEVPMRSWASWRAFHPDDNVRNYDGWRWYLNIQKAPLYRRDLDLVAISPEGEVASFCTIWYDDFSRMGYFEPVGTVGVHRRKGLGKAVLLEGLKRLWNLGAELACVSSYSEPAHALYSSVGFEDYEVHEPWAKFL